MSLLDRAPFAIVFRVIDCNYCDDNGQLVQKVPVPTLTERFLKCQLQAIRLQLFCEVSVEAAMVRWSPSVSLPQKMVLRSIGRVVWMIFSIQFSRIELINNSLI
jgi:hypothetical protein